MLKAPFSSLSRAQLAIKTCAESFPEMIPAGMSWRDIQIKDEGIAYRPCRNGGIRVEAEELSESLYDVHPLAE